MKKSIITLITIILLLTQIGCKSNIKEDNLNSKNFSAEDYSLGTICRVSIFDSISDDKSNQISEKVFKRLREIELRMTINQVNSEKSEIYKLNQNSGVNEVKLSQDTIYALEKGLEYSKLSNGLFDITIGPVVKLWNIGTNFAAVPKQKALNNSLKLVGYNNIKINKSAGTAKLLKKHMIVDLGAVAKGYAADEAIDILAENGVKHAIVNLGGNIRVLGSKPNGNDWSIGIQDPYETTNGKYFGIIGISNKTIVTSGIYERYFIENGKRYHHILSTKDGYPVNNEIASVSIITDLSVNADCLSTAVFTMGLEKGMSFVNSLHGVDALFITKDKKVFMTSGIKGKFNLSNKKYSIEN